MSGHLVLPLFMYSSYVIYYEPMYNRYSGNYCFTFFVFIGRWLDQNLFCFVYQVVLASQTTTHLMTGDVIHFGSTGQEKWMAILLIL